MDWLDVLDPDLTPEEVFRDKLPQLHRARREQFCKFVSTSLIFSVKFIDAGDQYTLLMGPDEVRYERGAMIDFPQATIHGTVAQWSRSLKLASELVVPADAQIDSYEGRIELTESIKFDFERFDGVLGVEIVELPDGGAPLTFDIILNDYEPPARAKRAKLVVEWSSLVELAHGRISPVEAARKVNVQGAMGLAFDIGGFAMREFDI